MAVLMQPRGESPNLIRRQPVLTIVPGILLVLNAVLAFVLTLVHLSPDSILSARGIVNAVGVLVGLILAQRKVTPWPLIEDGRDDGLAGDPPQNDPSTVVDLVNTDNAVQLSDGEQDSSVVYMTDAELDAFNGEGE